MTALERLYNRGPLGMRFGLEPMLEACARANHPERGLRIVHVAGTNGKGSVCAMLESIARASGLRTGLYTSPHLCQFKERIRIDGKPIEDLERPLARALEIGPELSFFEVATLAAFLAFADAKPDLVILEVGLGGRLDATNVIEHPALCAITRIAFDHMAYLGDTLTEIAREKAAIAKPGAEVIVGPQEEEAARVLSRFTFVSNEERRYVQDARISLAGPHQIENASIAYALARRLDLACVKEGLERAEWPGRLERISAKDGPVMLDAAHNPDGARALARALTGEGIGAMIFGALADKAWPEMIDALAPLTDKRVYVAPKGRAATDPLEIVNRHGGYVARDVASAYTIARELAGRETVLACGSISLIGPLRGLLLDLPCDPPIAL